MNRSVVMKPVRTTIVGEQKSGSGFPQTNFKNFYFDQTLRKYAQVIEKFIGFPEFVMSKYCKNLRWYFLETVFRSVIFQTAGTLKN